MSRTLVILIALAACATPPPQQPKPEPERLAVCLARTGAKLYGAPWCHWCHEQIRMFGKDADLVPYVDCDPTASLDLTKECVDIGIEFDSPLPMWIFADGRKLLGVRSLAALARASDCPAP